MKQVKVYVPIKVSEGLPDNEGLYHTDSGYLLFESTDKQFYYMENETTYYPVIGPNYWLKEKILTEEKISSIIRNFIWGSREVYYKDDQRPEGAAKEILKQHL